MHDAEKSTQKREALFPFKIQNLLPQKNLKKAFAHGERDAYFTCMIRNLVGHLPFPHPGALRSLLLYRLHPASFSSRPQSLTTDNSSSPTRNHRQPTTDNRQLFHPLISRKSFIPRTFPLRREGGLHLLTMIASVSTKTAGLSTRAANTIHPRNRPPIRSHPPCPALRTSAFSSTFLSS